MTLPGTPAAPPSAPRVVPDDLDVGGAPPSPWVRYVRGALWFCGGAYILLGLALGALFGGFAADDGELLGVGWAAVVFAFTAGWGALNFVAARGLGRGERWAWILGLVLGAVYATSICLPVGIVILVGLLRDDVRKAYLDD